MENPKVFIGLREVAGYFTGLKKGFDSNGVECAFLNLGGNRFNYESGKNPKWVNAFNKLGINLGSIFSKNFILRLIWLTTLQNVFSLFAFMIALFRYDVFILGGSSTFFFFLDYPILKLFGKKIICVYLGSDSRPIFLNGYAFKGEGNISLVRLLTRIQKLSIRIAERYADFIIQHPPQGLFNKKTFISWLDIGIPCTIPQLEKEERSIDEMTIIHIPSKSGPKGSLLFKGIIDRLKLKYNINYIEISGIPHHEVLKLISTADLALDEFYSDTPMAVFATECAFQKVPVVVGSYYAEEINNDYSVSNLPPSAFVLPEKIEEAIEDLILNKEKRIQLGLDAFNYVSSNWEASVVAQKFLKLIRNEYPNSWNYSPDKFKYIYGCGLSKDQLKINIKSFSKGESSKNIMLLRDKPNLNEQYLNIINEEG